MAIFDAGIFIAFALLGIGSLVISFKMGSAFKVVGAVSFFALSIVMLADYDVAFASQEILRNSTSGELITNQTNYHFIIGDNNSSTQSTQSWLGWLFLGMGVLGVLMFFADMMRMMK